MKLRTDTESTLQLFISVSQVFSFYLQVRAMRFPPKSYNKELESAEDRREREAQDLELAKEMAEDDDDAY